MLSMKVLTLTQPWASLVAMGAKRIETRSWDTDHRGPLAIHAAKNFPREAKEICSEQPFQHCLRRWYGSFDIPLWQQLPLGAVLCVSQLLATRPTEELKFIESANELLIIDERNTNADRYQAWWMFTEQPMQEYCFGNYGVNRFAWLLGSPRVLKEPIPAKGSLGLWNLVSEALI